MYSTGIYNDNFKLNIYVRYIYILIIRYLKILKVDIGLENIGSK